MLTRNPVVSFEHFHSLALIAEIVTNFLTLQL